MENSNLNELFRLLKSVNEDLKLYQELGLLDKEDENVESFKKAQEAVKAVGEDRVLKYYLKVK